MCINRQNRVDVTLQDLMDFPRVDIIENNLAGFGPGDNALSIGSTGEKTTDNTILVIDMKLLLAILGGSLVGFGTLVGTPLSDIP
jgi:hypothetical protein